MPNLLIVPAHTVQNVREALCGVEGIVVAYPGQQLSGQRFGVITNTVADDAGRTIGGSGCSDTLLQCWLDGIEASCLAQGGKMYR